MRRRTLLRAVVTAPALGVVGPRSAQASFDPGPYGSGWHLPWQGNRHCAPSEELLGQAVHSPRGVLVVGDSITVFSYAQTQESLTSWGWATAIDAQGGRPTAPSVDQVTALRTRGLLPATVVMATGTNDIFAPPAMWPHVDRLMLAVGPARRVLWVNIYAGRSYPKTPQLCSPSERADLRNSAWINSYLAASTRRHRNLRVIDWYGHLVERQWRLAAYLRDGIHLTAAGTRARCQMLGEALGSGRHLL